MNFFAEEMFLCDRKERDLERDLRSELSNELKDPNSSSLDVVEVQEMDEGDEGPIGIFERIHSLLAPSRRLNDLLFQEEIMVNDSQSEYIINELHLLA